MTIQDNLTHILGVIGSAQLLVVTKGVALPRILEAYALGCRDFGESRLQEALQKMEGAPSDIRWHFIGRLQKNKVGKVVGRFALIHSVDSVELAEKIGEASKERGVESNVLLQVNTSGEKTKAGLSVKEWKGTFSYLSNIQGLKICGLMTMAPLGGDEVIIRRSFSELRHLRDDLCLMHGVTLDTLSMGMSNDFRLAIEEGATLVRLGTAIFSPQ